jgi:hypothetical protein
MYKLYLIDSFLCFNKNSDSPDSDQQIVEISSNREVLGSATEQEINGEFKSAEDNEEWITEMSSDEDPGSGTEQEISEKTESEEYSECSDVDTPESCCQWCLKSDSL